MARWTCFFVLLSIAAVVSDVTAASIELENGYENTDDCMSPELACRDVKSARLCNAFDFCKKQAIPCAAEKFLVQGSKAFWQKSLQEVQENCAGQHGAFKKIYGSPDLVDIRLEVTPGRKPFTLSFDFKGDPTNELRVPGVRIKLNDKVVHDDLGNEETSGEPPLHSLSGSLTESSTESLTESTESTPGSPPGSTTVSSTESSTVSSTESSTAPTTESSTAPTTESTIESTIESSTKSSTESSTESTEPTTESTTETSTKSSTESSTESTESTVPTTESTTESSTKSSTKSSTESTESTVPTTESSTKSSTVSLTESTRPTTQSTTESPPDPLHDD